MVVDSAATSNIAKTSDPFEPTNEQSNKVFQTPFGPKAKASRRVRLPSKLRDPAATFEEVPAVKDDANSLLSTAKCTDAGYVQIFDKKGMKMFDADTTTILVSDNPVATAYRSGNLYRMAIEQSPTATEAAPDQIPDLACHDDSSDDEEDDVDEHEVKTNIHKPVERPLPEEAIANVYELKTQLELATYYHALAGFPTKSEWLQGWDLGSYQRWPGLTRKIINNFYPPESEETLKGHMRKKRAGLRSTKIRAEVLEDNKEAPTTPAERPDKKEGKILTKVFNLRDKLQRKIFIDQTGKFPAKSYRGYQYVMVLYDVDSNAILVEAIKDRTSGEMIRTYQALIDRLASRGIKPKHHMLDNEISSDFEEAIKKNKTHSTTRPCEEYSRESNSNFQGPLYRNSLWV